MLSPCEQDAPRKYFVVKEPLWCEGENGAVLAILPCNEFKVSYTLSYENASIGTQFFSLALNEKNFEKEIAPARTFCLKEEAIMLLTLGFGKGANYENTLVLSKKGPVKNILRFNNEPVRHKILDLIGDLYLIGMPIKGHVIAVKSGHRLNMEMVKKLSAKL